MISNFKTSHQNFYPNKSIKDCSPIKNAEQKDLDFLKCWRITEQCKPQVS